MSDRHIGRCIGIERAVRRDRKRAIRRHKDRRRAIQRHIDLGLRGDALILCTKAYNT